MQSSHLDMLWRQRGKCISRNTLPPYLKVGSTHPHETLHLSRETSLEVLSLCCVSLPHTALFCTYFLRRKSSQKAMRVLKGQCHFATSWLSYTFLSLAFCESEHLCPSLLLQPGSHWAGEDTTMFPCLLLLPGIPLNGDVRSSIWSWEFSTRTRYHLLFQSRDCFHCMQIWSEN